jgi:hypothetical protein
MKKVNELAQLYAFIARHESGIGIEALSQLLPMSRRTLQRRLLQLVEQGRILASGEGRAVRYTVAEPGAGGAEIYVVTSPEGKEIKQYVRQALHQRAPTGYNLAFLEQYLPNQTTYLPPALREQLHLMGRASEGDEIAGTFARDMLSRLLIDLAWASSHLEGNTYSHLDTARLIEFGQVAEGKNALETQMILNHKDAIEFLVCQPEQAGVSVPTVIALHAFLSDGLMADPTACGRLRIRPVEIGGSSYLPIAMPQRIEELLGIIIEMAQEIIDPFEQAFFLMVHLPYLQPFEDVNKRVSRLAANIPFIAHNLCPLSFIDVPRQAYIDAMLGVYELNRIELLRDVFIWAYERSCQKYLAVKQNLVPPDIIRLRYRKELIELVGSTILQMQAPSMEELQARISPKVKQEDREHFLRLSLIHI